MVYYLVCKLCFYYTCRLIRLS